MYTLLILTSMILIPIPVMMKSMLAGRNAYRGILAGSLSAMTGVALVFFTFWSVTGVTFFEVFNASLDRVGVENAGPAGYFMTQMKLQPDAMEIALENMREMTKLAVPGMLIILCLVTSYLNYAAISRVVRKTGKNISELPPFRTFSLPRNVVIGSMIIYGLSYIAVTMGIIGKDLMMFNLELLFTFVFSIQGLAVVFCFGYIKKIPKFIVVFVSAIFYLTWFGQTFLFLLGLIDVILDIRKRFPQTNLKI